MPRCSALVVFATACSCLPSFAGLLAADLRIETRVYALEEEGPISDSVTLFDAGVVYDFRTAESRVTIFRAGRDGKPARFILLDTKRQLRTEIDANQLTATMTKLRRWAAAQSDPFLRFTGAPMFEEQFNADTGELLLTSDQLSYRIVTVPLKHPEMRMPLRSFLDAYAQLHTLLEAGLPPEPRLRVNEVLFRHSVMPVEIQLTARDDEEPALRAEHVVAWVLSKQDRLRIDDAIDGLASYKKVTNAEFQQERRQVAAK